MKDSGEAPVFLDCVIRDNTAVDGGGVHNYAGHATYTNCSISGNVATEDGGGVMNRFGSTSKFDGCVIEDNVATRGGGVLNEFSEPTFHECHIAGNTATEGGGIASLHKSVPSLTNTTVCGNLPDQVMGPWTDGGGNLIGETCDPACPGDVDQDRTVGMLDLLVVLDQWGACVGCDGDTNGDGAVTIQDLLTVIDGWGGCG